MTLLIPACATGCCITVVYDMSAWHIIFPLQDYINMDAKSSVTTIANVHNLMPRECHFMQKHT